MISTTSGDANPAYDITMTSTVITDAAGATMLVPNAITRADPTIPRDQPAGLLTVNAHATASRSSVRAHPIRRDLAGMLMTCLLRLDLRWCRLNVTSLDVIQGPRISM